MSTAYHLVCHRHHEEVLAVMRTSIWEAEPTALFIVWHANCDVLQVSNEPDDELSWTCENAEALFRRQIYDTCKHEPDETGFCRFCQMYPPGEKP